MRQILIAALVAASFTHVDAFAARPLLPTGQDDQVPQRLVALPPVPGTFEHKPVSFTWKLDPTAPLSTPVPHQALSREHWQTVEASELNAGVPVKLSAPGALIRISPARGAVPLAVADVAVTQSGKRVPLARAVSAAQLQAAGMDVERGTVVAQLAPEQGAGLYHVQADGRAQGRYLMHVFEPRSQIVLSARARSDRAIAGTTQTVDLAIENGATGLAGASAQALLVAPDGRSYPAQVRAAGDGRLTAQARVPRDAQEQPGLWEMQVFAAADGIQRDARTAFAVVQPTARFSGDYAINRDALRVALPVQAGSPGRFEARGTLYASGPDRVLRPVAQAHSAAWIDPGRGMLVLDFERADLPAGYGAPFELRQLELHDQTRMAPLEVHGRAARF